MTILRVFNRYNGVSTPIIHIIVTVNMFSSILSLPWKVEILEVLTTPIILHCLSIFCWEREKYQIYTVCWANTANFLLILISSNFNQVDNIGVTPDYQLPMLMINNLTINMTIHHHHETSWISSWPWSWNWPMQWSGTQQQYLSYYQLPMLVSLDPFSSPFVSPWRGLFIVITITIIINRHNLPDPPSPLRQQSSSFGSPPLCHPSSFAWPCLYW